MKKFTGKTDHSIGVTVSNGTTPEELKPCAYCGSADVDCHKVIMPRELFKCHCWNCGKDGSLHKRKGKAIKYWNETQTNQPDKAI
jgi:hypothetical protein